MEKTIFGIIGFIGGYILFKAIGLASILFIIVFLLGNWASKKYIKEHKTENNVINWIAWSNLITWLLPILGIATAISSYNFSNNFKHGKNKYLYLAITGGLLSILNALWGVLLANS